MSLEESIFACFDGKKEITPESIQALIELIHAREKQWVEEVGRLKIDLHFSYLAMEEKDKQFRESVWDSAWQKRIDALVEELQQCRQELLEEREMNKALEKSLDNQENP